MKTTYEMDGMTLHVIPSKKFKNITVSLKLMGSLTKETTTLRTLLSFMLSTGTKDFPSTQLFSMHLEDMYGARFGSTIGSKGKGHVLSLSSVCVDQQFLPVKVDLLKSQLELLRDVLVNPNVVNGAFDKTIVDIKKKELKERIRASKDDKFTYSLDRLFEEMGKYQYLGISSTGYEKEIDDITPEQLVQHLEESILNDEKHLYLVGDVDESIVDLVQSIFPFKPVMNHIEPTLQFPRIRDEVQEIVEKQDITQAKLSMGYRIDSNFVSDNHYATTVFNALFGGFSQSRLFKVVREEHSLCYYVSSSYDAFNGILLVNAGIENDMYKKTVDLIGQELFNIQSGDFTDQEIELAKKMLKNALTKTNDEAGSMIALAYNRDCVRKEETNEEYLDKLLEVTKEQIIEVSKSVQLDTIYYLTGEKQNG